MRKLWVMGAAAMLLLAIAAVAIAQTAVTNTYDVDGGTTPSKAGSSKKPVPVQVRFDYQVGEVENRRPIPVKKYSIRFFGLTVNSSAAAKCSQATIDNEGAAGCPAKSIVGSGYIENETGQTSKPEDKSVPCNAKVTVINVGDRKANIYVEGSPTATDPREKCAIQLAAGIPANYVKRGKATALEFVVPDSLLHPGTPNLSNAVKRVQSTIKKITKKIKGKTHGYYEATGGCSKGKRKIQVVFTPETGPTATAEHLAACSK
jgi:hypothetical protein